MKEKNISGDVKNAVFLFERGNFKKVIQFLEPKIFEHRDDSDFYYYLGYASLLTGDFIKGNVYLQRGIQINPQDSRLFYGLALLHLKKNQIEDAVCLYLKLQTQNPDDKYAERGLEFIHGVDNRDLQKKLTLKQCISLLPGEDLEKKNRIKLLLFSAGFLAVIVAVLFIFKDVL